MKEVAKYIGFSMVLLLIAAAVLTFLAPRFGWSVDTLFSGSMEPHLEQGSVVVTRPVEAEDIKVGDIITFQSPRHEKLTTHRVMTVEAGSTLQFQTKGDANEDADPLLVSADDVVGKVWLHVPHSGYVTQFVKTPFGLLLTVCLPGLIIIGVEIRNILRELNKRDVERKHGIRQADEG